jgi:tetratricopeptide (TPR) repeat protein
MNKNGTIPRLLMRTGMQSRSRRTTPSCTDSSPALSEGNKIDGAISEYQVAIGLDETDAEYPNGLGDIYLLQGKFPAAEKQYRKAVSLAPNDAEKHRNLGDALRQQKQFDEAISELRQAIELNQYDSQARYLLGLALWDRGTSWLERVIDIAGKAGLGWGFLQFAILT